MKRRLTLVLLSQLAVFSGSWASAEHARSFRIEVPITVHGPERINLERLVERQHNIDLDHYDMHSLVLYAERRHSDGEASLKIGGYSSPYVYISEEWAGHVIPPPVRNGRDWRLNIGPGVFVTGIVMDLSPRTAYRNHGYSYGYYYDDRRYRHNRYRNDRHLGYSFSNARRHYKHKIGHLKHRLRHDYNDRHHGGRDRHRNHTRKHDRKRDRRHDQHRDRRHDRDRRHERDRGRDRNHDRNRDRNRDRNHNRDRSRDRDRNHDRDRNRDRDRSHDRGRDRSQDRSRDRDNGRGRGERTHKKVMTNSAKLRNHRKFN